MPLQTTNLWVKLQGPILKLTTSDSCTPTFWPLAVLMDVLLLDIWCKSPILATVSYLMQLTCAPVLNNDENTLSCTLILNVVPFVFPVFIKKIPLFLYHCCPCTCFCSPIHFILCYAKGLNKIILSNLIYLAAVPFLLP